MEDLDLYDKISSYLKGKMSPDEAAAFARQIEEDPQLRETVELYRLGYESLDAAEEEHLRQRMNTWDQAASLPSAGDAPKTSRRFWFGLALLALLVAGFWFFQPAHLPPAPVAPPPTAPPVRVDTPVINPPPTDPGDPSVPKHAPAPFAAAVQKLYDNEKTDWSVRRIRSDLPPQAGSVLDGPGKRMNEGKPRQALQELDRLPTQKDPAIQEEAEWMKAHACLQTGDYDRAARLFEPFTRKSNTRDAAQWYRLLSLAANYRAHQAQVDGLLRDILSQEFPDDPLNNHPYLEQARGLRQALNQAAGR